MLSRAAPSAAAAAAAAARACVLLLIASHFLSTCEAAESIRITTQARDVQNVNEHSSVTLECQSTTAHVTWTHDSQQVSNSTGRRYITEEKSIGGLLTSRLKIISAEPEDAGIYVCACHHTNLEDRINVTVSHVKTRIDGPHTIERSVGSELQLTCWVDNHLQSARWFFKDVQIGDSSRDSVTSREDQQKHLIKVVLLRKNMTSNDFGVYSCRNTHEQASVTVKLSNASSDVGRRNPVIGLSLIVCIAMMWVLAD